MSYSEIEILGCFAVLGLPANSSNEQIRQTYRDLVQVWHPDRFVNNPRLKTQAEQKLKEINAAYEILEQHFRWMHETTASSPSTESTNPNVGYVYRVQETCLDKNLRRWQNLSTGTRWFLCGVLLTAFVQLMGYLNRDILETQASAFQGKWAYTASLPEYEIRSILLDVSGKKVTISVGSKHTTSANPTDLEILNFTDQPYGEKVVTVGGISRHNNQYTTFQFKVCPVLADALRIEPIDTSVDGSKLAHADSWLFFRTK